MNATVGTRIDLVPPVPAMLADEVGTRLLFVSPDVVGFELGPLGGGDLREVTLYSHRPLGDDVAAKVHRMLDNDVRAQAAAPADTVWTSPHPPSGRGDPWPQLVDARVVTEAGEGQVAVGEPLLSLMDVLDELVVEHLTGGESDVHGYRYPTLIRAEVLHRSGYLANFPQHLMIVTRLHNDIEVYHRFRDDHVTGGLTPDVLGLAGNVDYCLPPTMCYHTFHQLRGTEVDTDPVHVVTARGKAFRFEAGYATTLERLWDFTIREIVVLGGKDAVAAARERFLRAAFTLAEQLGLAGSAVVANDPFFGATDTPARILGQRLMSLKYELRLPVADRTVAVASFNLHGDIFGTAFDIRDGSALGRPVVHSACVGYGLERLVHAFVWQHGADPAGWPGPVRERLDERARR